MKGLAITQAPCATRRDPSEIQCLSQAYGPGTFLRQPFSEQSSSTLHHLLLNESATLYSKTFELLSNQHYLMGRR